MSSALTRSDPTHIKVRPWIITLGYWRIWLAHDPLGEFQHGIPMVKPPLLRNNICKTHHDPTDVDRFAAHPRLGLLRKLVNARLHYLVQSLAEPEPTSSFQAIRWHPFIDVLQNVGHGHCAQLVGSERARGRKLRHEPALLKR